MNFIRLDNGEYLNLDHVVYCCVEEVQVKDDESYYIISFFEAGEFEETPYGSEPFETYDEAVEWLESVLFEKKPDDPRKKT